MRPLALLAPLVLATAALGACATRVAPAPHVALAPPGDAEGAQLKLEDPEPELGDPLPTTLQGQLEPTKANDARALVLTSQLIATAECPECGVPRYAHFESVECDDPFTCRVSTASCEGTISRSTDVSISVDLRPREGGDPVECAAYSGDFVPPPPTYIREDPGEMPTGHVPRVVLADPTSSAELVDLVASREVVHEHVGELIACYRNSLAERGELNGVLQVAVEHQDDGGSLPSLAHSNLDDTQLEQCVLRAFRRWPLPGARDGSAARVYFSISFVPG